MHSSSEQVVRDDSQALLARFRRVVGPHHVLVSSGKTRRYRKGYRIGMGRVLAVVRPGTLLEQWKVFTDAVQAGLIVIMQAANTGLTGGSTPDGDDYDRDIVIINTMRIGRIDLIDGGKQVLCLAGATLNDIESRLRPLGREPHSIIGSTSIGASVVGGICNNSGGALLRRGPAFTQLALYAQVDADGKVTLVNHLGIKLGDLPEEILTRLDVGDYQPEDIIHDPSKRASDPEYETLIRDVDSDLPARYNNDRRLLHEVSGSAGKLCVFAVRTDTFQGSGPSRVFYIGSNDYRELADLRRNVLSEFRSLPVTGEYLNRDAYDLSRRFGKDMFLLLKFFGTKGISRASILKSRFDAAMVSLGLPSALSDRILQQVLRLLPDHLPRRMGEFRDAYEHHILVRADGDGIDEIRAYLGSVFPSASGDFFECDESEGTAAYRHRYVVGGAVVRYKALHRDKVSGVIALDLAYPRNAPDWRDMVPPDVEDKIIGRSRCGHFFCHVFHYDFIVGKGHDSAEVEHRILEFLSEKGIELPSEHNVGHHYRAKQPLAEFYRSLDPTNTLNPGIGRTSKRKNWG